MEFRWLHCSWKLLICGDLKWRKTNLNLHVLMTNLAGRDFPSWTTQEIFFSQAVRGIMNLKWLPWWRGSLRDGCAQCLVFACSGDEWEPCASARAISQLQLCCLATELEHLICSQGFSSFSQKYQPDKTRLHQEHSRYVWGFLVMECGGFGSLGTWEVWVRDKKQCPVNFTC